MGGERVPLAEHAAPFAGLTPEAILAAVESLGLHCDGRVLALNSYENRVYRIGIEAEPPRVAKFYRPSRWSDAAILEEHAFSAELCAADISVVAPQNDRRPDPASPRRHALRPVCDARRARSGTR